jgi:hypothetical protein
VIRLLRLFLAALTAAALTVLTPAGAAAHQLPASGEIDFGSRLQLADMR